MRVVGRETEGTNPVAIVQLVAAIDRPLNHVDILPAAVPSWLQM